MPWLFCVAMSLRFGFRIALLAAIGAPLVACSSAVRKPRLLHPGPASFQRYNATQFDPYPQNDMAPEIVGGRPLDYQVPPNEVTRARQFTDGRAGSATSLPTAVPGATITGAPTFIPPPTAGLPPAPVVGPAIPVVSTPPVSTMPVPAGPPITYRY
jgi:hypothetical protein